MRVKNWCKMDPEWLKENLEIKDTKMMEAYLFYLKRLCFHIDDVTQAETVRPLTQRDEIKIVNKIVTNSKYKDLIIIMNEIAVEHKNFEVIRHFNWLKNNTKLGDRYGY